MHSDLAINGKWMAFRVREPCLKQLYSILRLVIVEDTIFINRTTAHLIKTMLDRLDSLGI